MPDVTPDAQQRGQQADWRPIPDPTDRTTIDLNRAVQAERDYVDGKLEVLVQRLEGIDRATELLNETVNRVPTETQVAVGRLQDLMDEKFRSIATQFEERDTRQERESRDNKVAVDAAFAAADKAAAKSEEVFQASISKSEAATAETISKLQDLTRTQAENLTSKIDDLGKALSDKIDDLKVRVTSIEAAKLGGRESDGDRQQQSSSNRELLYLVIAAIGIFVTVAIATHGFHN